MKNAKLCAVSLAVAVMGAAVLAQTAKPARKADKAAAGKKADEIVMRARADIKGEGITGTAEFTEIRPALWGARPVGHR